jgi:single-strand DNA-binding protein
MNQVVLVGRLDADPVSRLVGGQTVVRMRLAVRSLRERHPTRVDVDIWGKQGAAVARYLTTGRLVAVSGRLASSVWRDGVTNRREHVYVHAQAVDFLDQPRRATNVAPTER